LTIKKVTFGLEKKKGAPGGKKNHQAKRGLPTVHDNPKEREVKDRKGAGERESNQSKGTGGVKDGWPGRSVEPRNEEWKGGGGQRT